MGRLPVAGRLPASAHPSAPEQVDDGQQDDGANQRYQDADEVDSIVDRSTADPQHAGQPATKQGADDADHDVEEDTLLGVGLHDEAGDPADDAADNQPNDETDHAVLLVRPVSGWRKPLTAGARTSLFAVA